MTRGGAVQRTLLALLALTLSWLAVGHLDLVAAAPSAAADTSYTYDSPERPIADPSTRLVRGPPGMSHRQFVYDAVDRGSRGALERHDGPTLLALITYDHPAPLVQVTRRMPATQRHVQVVRGAPTSLRPAGVAAKRGWASALRTRL